MVHILPAADLITSWTLWQRAGGLSNRTISERTRLVLRVARETGSHPAQLQTEQIAAFLSRHDSASTRAAYHCRLRSWSQWLVLMDYRIDDPTLKLRPPKQPRRRPRPVSVDQLGAILSTRTHRRTRVMILLAAYQGLRAAEIARMRGEHIHGGDIVTVLGKGDVEEDLPLHPLLVDVAQTMPAVGYWFPSRAGGHIRGTSVSTIIRQVMDRAGIPRYPYTPHSLRHFFGTEALRAAGGNVAVAQQLLRHANLSTTSIYLKVDDTERRAAIHALPVPPAARRAA